MSRKFTTKFLTETEYEKWSKFVSESPTGTIYSLPEYLKILCEITGDQFRILAVFQGSELVAGIALYEVWSKFLPVGISFPHRLLTYHSVVFKEYSTNYISKKRARYAAILEVLINKLLDINYVYLKFNIYYLINDMRSFLNVGWKVIPSYSYLVDIQDIENVWHNIEQNLRRLVNRGIKNGLNFCVDDDFDSFFKLYSNTYQRKGISLYFSENQYKKYYEFLREKNLCQLHQVRLNNNQSVGAFLILTDYNYNTYTVCAGSDNQYFNLGSSAFLRWKSFEYLSTLGYKNNDLTGASLGNVNNFKNQLGGNLITNWSVEKPTHFSYLLYRKLRDFTKFK
ncbi:GNAT family N-acetyltransferase [Geminocystis sp.]|uniref:GNAT family N-acetyltransferase n=1 Tax=Geminocystis sp. TaxID=2664100 RepID=UPI003593E596